MDANSTKLFRVKADSAFDSQAISRALPTRFNAYEVQKAHSQHALHAHRKANATNSALNSKVFLGISHTHKATSQAFANLNSNSAESRLTNWGGGGRISKIPPKFPLLRFLTFCKLCAFCRACQKFNPKSPLFLFTRLFRACGYFACVQYDDKFVIAPLAKASRGNLQNNRQIKFYELPRSCYTLARNDGTHTHFRTHTFCHTEQSEVSQQNKFNAIFRPKFNAFHISYPNSHYFRSVSTEKGL